MTFLINNKDKEMQGERDGDGMQQGPKSNQGYSYIVNIVQYNIVNINNNNLVSIYSKFLATDAECREYIKHYCTHTNTH